MDGKTASSSTDDLHPTLATTSLCSNNKGKAKYARRWHNNINQDNVIHLSDLPHHPQREEPFSPHSQARLRPASPLNIGCQSTGRYEKSDHGLPGTASKKDTVASIINRHGESSDHTDYQSCLSVWPKTSESQGKYSYQKDNPIRNESSLRLCEHGALFSRLEPGSSGSGRGYFTPRTPATPSSGLNALDCGTPLIPRVFLPRAIMVIIRWSRVNFRLHITQGCATMNRILVIQAERCTLCSSRGREIFKSDMALENKPSLWSIPSLQNHLPWRGHRRYMAILDQRAMTHTGKSGLDIMVVTYICVRTGTHRLTTSIFTTQKTVRFQAPVQEMKAWSMILRQSTSKAIRDPKGEVSARVT